MTSPTDIIQYCTVRSWDMRKRIDHWCSVVLQASFPTGTVGPCVEIFLSPVNTNDGFYLSHKPVPARGKVKKRTAARRPHAGRTSIRDVIVMVK